MLDEESTREPRPAILFRVFSPQLQNLLRLNSTLVPIFCLLHSPPPTPLTSSPHPLPPRLPEHVPALPPRTCNGSETDACGEQDQGYFAAPLPRASAGSTGSHQRPAATEGLLQPGEPSGAKGVRATGPTSSGGVECRVRRGTVRCSALTQVTGSRHKTLLRQWRRLIGRCAAGYASCAAEPR